MTAHSKAPKFRRRTSNKTTLIIRMRLCDYVPRDMDIVDVVVVVIGVVPIQGLAVDGRFWVRRRFIQHRRLDVRLGKWVVWACGMATYQTRPPGCL